MIAGLFSEWKQKRVASPVLLNSLRSTAAAAGK